MARHRQKDEEAGGEGLGVVATRKKLWKDAHGNIARKRPAMDRSDGSASKKQTIPQSVQHAINDHDNHVTLHAQPISPSLSTPSIDYATNVPHYVPTPSDDSWDSLESLHSHDMFDFLANSTWDAQAYNTSSMQMTAPFEDSFNPDTGQMIQFAV